MSADTWIKFLNVLVSFIQVTSWPLLVLMILLYLRTPLKKFIGELIEVTLKAGPIETIAKRQEAVEAAVSLTAVTTARALGAKPAIHMESAQRIARLINQIASSQASQKLHGASVLWVDDKPSNNVFEVNALEALGVQFSISASTEDALEKLRSQKFDLIVSDVGRPPDSQAGYTLLAAINKMHITTPFIICAEGGSQPQYKEKNYKAGAFGSTDDPLEFFELAINAINRRSVV